MKKIGEAEAIDGTIALKLLPAAFTTVISKK